MAEETIQSSPAAETLITPVLEYAPYTLRARLSTLQKWTIGLLGAAVVIYAIACIPSYHRSYWPPPERIVEAPPWLWAFAIPAFTLIVPGGWFSRIALLLYALLTGVIDAWTFPFANMNPQVGMQTELWLGNLPIVVVLHLVLTAILALLFRLIYYLCHLSPLTGTMPQSLASRCGRITVLASIPLLATAFPFVYQKIMVARDAADGAAIADTDWANRAAKIVTNDFPASHEVGFYGFASMFDAETGFPLKQSWLGLWEPGYNTEIRRLVKVNGIPSWSQKFHSISDTDLIRMLTAADMRKITTYPSSLSPDLFLSRGTGITPWGVNMGTNSKYLQIATRHQDFLPIGPLGQETDPAFVGQLAKYPGIFSIRCGNSVAVCTADGWFLEYITDNR